MSPNDASPNDASPNDASPNDASPNGVAGTQTKGFFNGHRIVRHAKAGTAWFTVDHRDYPRFDSCAEAAEWIDKHLAKDGRIKDAAEPNPA